jgi:hypothetical protein
MLINIPVNVKNAPLKRGISVEIGPAVVTAVSWTRYLLFGFRVDALSGARSCIFGFPAWLRSGAVCEEILRSWSLVKRHEQCAAGS